ncbi:MAG: ABC-2 transporter permease [Limnochordia bacterium]|nr:ABC-2 transporter permease [Limnochordia bacterium]
MGYLVLKDLLLQKKMLLLAFLYVFMFTFAFQGMGEAQLVTIISAVGYTFVMLGGAWEEKNTSDVLWNSLAVPKWKIVGAKYLAIPVYVAIVILVYGIVSPFMSLLRVPVRAMPLDLVGAVLGMVAVFIAASVYYPVYFALGYAKSRYWHFIVFFGVMISASMLPTLFPNKPEWIDPLFERLPELARGEAVPAALGVVFVILVGVSFFASLRLYGRREF